jgi:glycerol-3-phosphate dehydrogenase (NAD(P)+)
VSTLAVIGGGSWGTALSVVLAPKFDSVKLWVHEKEIVDEINQQHSNRVFLPDIAIPANINASSQLDVAVHEADFVLAVMPSHFVRSIALGIQQHFPDRALLVTATKGIESGTLLRMSEVWNDVLHPAQPVSVLSGPTFAKEVARGEPAAIAIASESKETAVIVQAAFSGPAFRIYTNDDPIGVEVGAALKNIIAIAAGICQGLGLGSNARAALITRGLTEITRLAVAMGGKPKTLAGLAGLGDLVLTCTGELSRNRSVGLQLAAGKSIQEIQSGMRMIAEGIETTHAAMGLAARYQVSLPITEQMQHIINGDKSPREALRHLMERTLKEE